MKNVFHGRIKEIQQIQEAAVKHKELSHLTGSLSNQEAYRLISEQLSQLLCGAAGYTCDQQTVSDIVVQASVEGSTIEKVCNSLKDAPTGATIRLYLNEELSVTEMQEIECAVNAQLQADLPSRLWKKPLELAIDLHDEPFYGKDPLLQAYACRGEAHQGTTWFYRVATVYVVHRHIPYTLGIVFVLPEYGLDQLIATLLQRIQALELRIRRLYLDKGFCTPSVIAYFKTKPYEVIIACPIRGKKGGTRALCKGRKSYFTTYTFHAGKPQAYSVTLAVVRTYQHSRGKRRAAWLLYVVVNCSTRDPLAIGHRYRFRFGIETGYRCMRQTHAITTSRNPVLRFFFLAVAFLIVNLWISLRWRFCQRPRRGGRKLDKAAYELHRHRLFIAQVISGKYHPIDSIFAIAHPLDP
jgi:putative transposase